MSVSTGHRGGGASAVLAAPHPDWQLWDKLWTRTIRQITGRLDMTVVVAPGAGGGAPACTYPTLGQIEVDATHIGTPDIANPRQAGHKRLVPVGYGLLMHEAAHTVHSKWTLPPGTPAILIYIADLLEEARVEGRHRSRRPRDRQYLAATTTALVHPADAPIDTPWHAAGLAALLLARVDARILAAKQVRGVRDAITTVLGRKRLNQLRDIWRQALAVGDDDGLTMLELAHRWCTVVGIDPKQRPDPPQADAGEFTGRLAAAIAAWAAAATGLSLGDYLAAAASGNSRRLAAATRAGRHLTPRGWPLRTPTPAEHTAARTLAARLATARTSNPEPGRAPSTVPPGRLRTRAAITAQAQRAAGQLPTAAPFTRRTPQPPDKPHLKIGVLVDVSGSMAPYAAPMSQFSWTLAVAAHGNQASTVTIAFADDVVALTQPGRRTRKVLEVRTGGGSDMFPAAVKLADQLLELRRAGSIRMLAVVSDGDLHQPHTIQKLVSTLHHDGVWVLWIRPDGLAGHTFTDTTTLTVADPLAAITAIGDAAVAAIAAA